jgi:3',5'-cyclic AMP phosphodiesterase CpdA
MPTLLHLSDLHFGRPYLPKVGQAVLNAADELKPDIIVVSGDFTQRAREQEFRAAQEFLRDLPQVPLVVTPGNHDVPMLLSMRDLRRRFRLYRKYIRPELDFHLLHEDVAIVSLNSTPAVGSLMEGWISLHQLDYCREVFGSLPPETLRIVVAHHHLAPVPKLHGGSVMHLAERAIERFTELKVDLILGGHKHVAYVGNSLDFYPGIDREHGIIIVQSGTTTSRRGRAREREKNTFNLIQLDGLRFHIRHYMYFKEVGGFEISSEHVYPRSTARFVKTGVTLQALAD